MSRLLDKLGAEGGSSMENTTAVTGFLNEPGKWSQSYLKPGTAGNGKSKNGSSGGGMKHGGPGNGGYAKGFSSKMAVAELSEDLKDISHHFSRKRTVAGSKRRTHAKKGKALDGMPLPTTPAVTLPSLEDTATSAEEEKEKVVVEEPAGVESTLVVNHGGSSDDDSDVDPEVANIKTSKDVIDYYIRHGHNAQIKLFHCNTMPQGDNFNPYQLEVVDRQKVNMEHFTISSSGVVHVQSATHAEFTPLGEWIREQSIFNLLTQMKFFKYYIVNKMFKSWWSKVRHTLYRQVRERLKKKLFLAKPTFCPTLMEVYGFVTDVSNTALSNISHNHCYNIDEFAEQQQQHRIQKAIPAIEGFVERIQRVLEKVAREVITQERQYRASVEKEIGDRTGISLLPGNVSKTKSMVAVKQEKIERARTYKRVVEEAKMLGAFIRLVDNMLVEAIVGSAIGTVEHLLGILQNPSRAKGFFSCTVGFASEGMSFNPPESHVLKNIDVIIEGIISCVNGIPRLLFMRSFSSFFEDRLTGPNPVQIVQNTPKFSQLRVSCGDAISASFGEATEYATIFENHRPVFEFGQSWDADAYDKKESTVQEFRQDMSMQREWRNELERSMKISNVVGVLYIDSRTLREELKQVTSNALDSMKMRLLVVAREHCTKANEGFAKRVNDLSQRPPVLDGFVTCLEIHNQTMKTRKQILAESNMIDDMYDMLNLYEMKIPMKDQVALDDLHENVSAFKTALDDVAEFIEENKANNITTLNDEIVEMNESLLAMLAELHGGSYIDPESEPETVLKDLAEVAAAIDERSRRAETFRHYQALFQMPQDDFSNVSLTQKELDSRRNTWNALFVWENNVYSWLDERFDVQNPLDIEDIETTVDDAVRSAHKMAKANKEDRVVYRLKDEIDSFKEYLPLLRELANPALQPRHWEQIFTVINKPYHQDVNFSIRKLIEYGILDHMEAVENISGVASKEWSMLKTLQKMNKEWDGKEFMCMAYKDSGTFILASTDDIQAILDDQIVKIQAMSASPFAKPFKDQVNDLETMMQTLQDLIDNWLKCQQTWLYLEPIFSSEDIVKQMPEEGSKFQEVDIIWRELMAKTQETPVVVTIAKDAENLEQLIRCNELLDSVQKGLAAYLEKKRLFFPRFFFLSNDEMLEILSETKDPTRVQPHMKKCFEGIDKLVFEGDKMEITGMTSVEKETVPFKNKVEPAKANGSVEKWLVEVEAAMFESVHDVAGRGIEAYSQTPRIDWIVQWPGMVVLVVTAIFWTKGVTQAITDGKVTEYGKQLTSDLLEVVGKVRGQLTKLERQTLGALVVMDVHARDVVDNMSKSNVSSPEDFDWAAQLRTYWEPRPDAEAGTPEAEEKTAMLRMMSAEVEYGYEYLGNSSRLVITPLTDRAYRTLIGAIHMTLGGAPEGPAGTGKTETTKDLARALARQCVVFNCSDSLDYIAMGKFFKGLASAGAWACFDEFNRIDLEVLSVVAQQVLDLQRAIGAKVETFMFEGTELRLKCSAWCSITMNPGYAGRSELPDNLKALFRTVAMMVPDYALIAEIILFSNGYLSARECSKKIVQCYKLCSEQLSSQDHYDYGMRAVIAVLRAAANLKRAFPEEDELVLILRSIIDVNLCKFLSHDLPLFKGITNDLFPGVVLPKPDYDQLEEHMRKACVKFNLEETPYFFRKTIELYEMIQVRHGLMLVGLPMGGKSGSYKVLAEALTTIRESGDESQEKVNYHCINPKSITIGQLYGQFDPITHEWTDGVLAVTFRSCASEFNAGISTNRRWLVLDGPVDAIWIENMNTVLDDNKKLCLNSGEIISMSRVMTMIFEVNDLAVASPATVSRCGMVYLEPSELGWQPILESWLREDLPKSTGGRVPGLASYLRQIFTLVLPESLRFLRREIKEIAPTSDSNVACSMMATLASTLHQIQAAFADHAIKEEVKEEEEEAEEKESGEGEGEAEAEEAKEGAEEKEKQASPVKKPVEEEPPEALADELRQIVDNYFLFALTWSVGGTAGNLEGRKHFTEMVMNLIMLKKTTYTSRGGENYTFGVEENSPKLPKFTLSKNDITLQTIEAGDEAKDSFSSLISLHDFVYDGATNTWSKWESRIDLDEFMKNAVSSNEIIIPTIDTVRYTYLLQSALERGVRAEGKGCAMSMPLLLVGPTGTGKSVYLQKALRVLDAAEWAPAVNVNFSARTSANITQTMIDIKLDKRRKGIYGPPPGKHCVIFIDDLNMPQLETYGAQPPIELVRQFADHGGWYEGLAGEWTFRNMIDVILCSAMGPPGGGRNPVTGRFLRHFAVTGILEFTAATLMTVFNSILTLGFENVSSTIKVEIPKVVQATNAVYNEVMAKLLPTPSKSHYVFNLRDFARVVRGVMLIAPKGKNKKSSIEESDDIKSSFIRLWGHEILRVFYDRLVDDNDRDWFIGFLREVVAKDFSVNLDELFEHIANDGKVDQESLRNCFFGDYMTSDDFDRADLKTEGKLTYVENQDSLAIIERMEMYLKEYNALSKSQMNLAMFLYAIEHTSRICRVLKQPGAHMLNVGVGGSGRQSLSRLAAYICAIETFQIAVSKSYGLEEWKEDLRKLIRRAGGDGVEMMFLFSDTQINDEVFVEDINNLLNTGEVPNLFPQDEKPAVMEQARLLAKKLKDPAANGESPQELWDFFVKMTKQNLHVVLCMSPVGDAFRERLRQFPSLVNCCTIDWFQQWPADALEAVARTKLNAIDELLKSVAASEEVAKQQRLELIKICKMFHADTRNTSYEFKEKTGRISYVTPTSYLELLSTLATILKKKNNELETSRKRYVVGLDKLNFTATQVGAMQDELTALKPNLEKTVKETEELMERIKVEKAEVVEPKAAVVDREVAEAQTKGDQANAIKMECEEALAEAIPALEAAMAALDTIKAADINLVKNFKNPPAAVKLVLEAVCVCLDVKPARIADPAGSGKKIEDYWEPSKGLLSDKGFIDRLKTYDKDNVPVKVIDKVRSQYTSNPDFTPANAAKGASAAEGLCKWVFAIDSYDRVAKIVAPKKKALAEAEAEYNEVMVGLKVKQAELQELQDKLALLENQLEESITEKQRLENEVELCAQKLERAEKLIGGLGGERQRWSEAAQDLAEQQQNVLGDVLIAAGFISYLGVFTMPFREGLTKKWTAECKKRGIPCSDVFTMQQCLGDPVKIREWSIAGLPNDQLSIDNAIVVANARRWPLFIDPQNQANKWVKKMEQSNNVQVIKFTDSDYMRTLENAVQFGLPVVLENVGEEIEPSLEPLLLNQTFKQGGVICIKLGESVIEFSNDFRFYITTALRNPHYLPEVSVKVTLLNFMITPHGLADQLLGVVVAEERPDLEEQHQQLVIESAENKRKLTEIENKILHVLSSSEGNILEDTTAIQILSEAKVVSREIEEKQAIGEETQKMIEETRTGYKSCGEYNAMLYFCVADFANIDPMYQYSLSWFIALFVRAIHSSKKSDKDASEESSLETRLDDINSYFTYSLYCNICRSLFVKDKLLFAFVLSLKILETKGEFTAAEQQFLLTGGIGAESKYDASKNPVSDLIEDRVWESVCKLSGACPKPFATLPEHVERNSTDWQELFETADPFLMNLPPPYCKGDPNEPTPAQKLLLIRSMRPDKFVPAVSSFVESSMGRKFTEPPTFDLELSYNESSCICPLIFVLSIGSDPTAALLKYAEDRDMASKLSVISMGQGQGPKAAKLIEQGIESGGWVLLQNCHLAASWMPTLEKIYEGIKPETCEPDFRLWVTSMPSKAFPLSILQNGVKMTNEPPSGVRANLKRSLGLDPISDEEFFESCPKSRDFKRLLFGLCFIHAFVQERKKFGPIGWNIPYSFNDSDLRISVRQLHMYVGKSGDELPFAALKYTIGECNYGGRVTDDKDRRLLSTLLDLIYDEKITGEEFNLSSSGVYRIPKNNTLQAYVEYVDALPTIPRPEVFGLHDNADITKDLNDTNQMIATLITTMGEAGGGGDSGGQEQVVRAMCSDILERLPPNFDIEKVQKAFPVLYEQSLNQVLTQEMLRYNRLTTIVRNSLVNVIKAIDGTIVMSSDLEKVYNSLSIGKVPPMWMSKSYPSMKPAAAYVEDFFGRLNMLQSWYEAGAPPSAFWLPGFFFTPSFCTAVLQNYARKNKLAIDTIAFDFEMLDMDPEIYKNGESPTNGVYVYGMYLEGCGWDIASRTLSESRPRVLFEPSPVIWFKPVQTKDLKERPCYACPVYRTADRRGVLATTGHSTNFLMFLNMPTDKPEHHWTMRGVCMLLSLSY
ncbi:heavy chain of dynein [Chloropicon primus]|nr:heavy chain of dynein [Chloropicon primus]